MILLLQNIQTNNKISMDVIYQAIFQKVIHEILNSKMPRSCAEASKILR